MTKPFRIEADWNTWAFIPTTTLQEAVFLSLDLEPVPQGFNYALVMACAQTNKTDPIGVLREFNRRMKIASANIEELAKFSMAYHRDIPSAKVSLSRFGTWAENIGWILPDKFPRQTAPDQPIDATDREADASTLVAIKNEPAPAKAATTAPVVATSDGPAPLTRSEIANCFAGLRGWDVERWKSELSSPDNWLGVCQQRKGTRGRGGYESTWWPVCIAVAMVDRNDTTAKMVSARFKSQEPLKPWLDAFKNNYPETI